MALHFTKFKAGTQKIVCLLLSFCNSIDMASRSFFVAAKSVKSQPTYKKRPEILHQIQKCYKQKIEEECGTSLY